MKPKTFAALCEAIDTVLNDEADDRGDVGYVYEQLGEDMANAARSVYDACMRGQAFGK